MRSMRSLCISKQFEDKTKALEKLQESRKTAAQKKEQLDEWAGELANVLQSDEK